MNKIIPIFALFVALCATPAAAMWVVEWTTTLTSGGVGGPVEDGKATAVSTMPIKDYDGKYEWFGENASQKSDSLASVPSGAKPVLRLQNSTNVTLQAYLNTTASQNLAKSEVWIRRGDGNLYVLGTDGSRATVCDRCSGDHDFYLIRKLKDVGSETVTVKIVTAFVEA